MNLSSRQANGAYGRRAFTLIELLVVMGIVCILMALLFMGMNFLLRMRMRWKAEETLNKLAMSISNLKTDADVTGFITSNHVDSGKQYGLPIIPNTMQEGVITVPGTYGGNRLVDLKSDDDIDIIIWNDNIARELDPDDVRYYTDPGNKKPYYWPVMNVNRKPFFGADKDSIKVPVYDAPIGFPNDGLPKLVDPWGHPYMFIIVKAVDASGSLFDAASPDSTNPRYYRKCYIYSLGPADPVTGKFVDNTLPSLLAGTKTFGTNIVREIDQSDVPNTKPRK
jgi:prepilin-type N-terminal cleavage/methylation domain-containing protein